MAVGRGRNAARDVAQRRRDGCPHGFHVPRHSAVVTGLFRQESHPHASSRLQEARGNCAEGKPHTALAGGVIAGLAIAAVVVALLIGDSCTSKTRRSSRGKPAEEGTGYTGAEVNRRSITADLTTPDALADQTKDATI